jgi:O-antigen/teichoic acid export membrane protein
MDKALTMGKDSASGSFQLFIGKTLSTVILAVGTIILGVFIKEGDYGLYAVALIPAATILLFQDWGIGSAMTKYLAQYRSMNDEEDLRKVIKAGLTFEAVTGVVLTVVSLLMANLIASTVFNKPESAFLITVSSIAILFAALFTAAQSVFVGFERMELSSYTIICQAVAQGVLSPLLVYLLNPQGYGALGAILGYTLSFVVAGTVAPLLLYFTIFRKLAKNPTSKSNLTQTLKPLLRYGVPLAVATILAGILAQFYFFIMASVVPLEMIGNYRIATNFAVLLTFFTVPISTVLFPAFSKLNPKTEQPLLQTVFASSVKYTSLFLVPATLAMMVLAKPIISTLYPDKWLFAPPFLALCVVINLSAIFGNLSVGSLLTGLGETRMLMKLNILNLALGVPMALVLIPQLGIIGLILVTIVAAAPAILIGIYWSWKRYGTKADFQSSAKILLASAIAAGTAYLFLNAFNVAEWIRLATGGLLFLAVYLVAAPLVGAVNQTDVNNLRSMFSSLGVISKLLEIPLMILEQPLKARESRAKTKKQ